MNVIILSASPNTDGLTAACAQALLQGIQQAGGSGVEIRLNDLDIASCEACGNGWGTCHTEYECQVEDDFQQVHHQVCAADALALVTPVYWGEMSESAKAFTDRLRRCEASRRADSRLAGKPVVAVAAAGGSGGGMITCLASLERWLEHVRLRRFDLIPVNRWSREYKLEAIRAAGATLIHLESQSG